MENSILILSFKTNKPPIFDSLEKGKIQQPPHGDLDPWDVEHSQWGYRCIPQVL